MTRPVTTPGRLVADRYRLKSRIGGGGMGTVWLARDELLGRDVAVKQVLTPPGAAADEADQMRQRALREGRIAARLTHPHAISVYDVALEADQPWLVMEYLPSRSLSAVLGDDGVLRVDLVAQIGAQVADALAATHAAGIVHRDVKPGNVLIGQGGRVEGLVKITDFGISHARGDVTLTQTGQITGTPAYLAPEVARGHPMTEASDVYSLGATLYTCVEGQPPFGVEDNALAMLHKVAGGRIIPPRRAGMLDPPLLRMLSAEPGDRPTMADVRDELAALAAGHDGDTTTVLLARTDLASGAQRNRTTAFAAGPQPEPAPAPPATPVPPPQIRRPEPAPGAEPASPAGRAPAAEPVRPRGRRRGRALWALAAVVAALLAGLIVFWAAVPDPGDDGSQAQGTPTPTSTTGQTTTDEADETDVGDLEPEPEPRPEPEPEPEPTVADEPTDDAPPPDPLSAGNIERFLADYHDQVLTDPRAAYARTGPTLRANIGEDDYVAYWRQFSDVRLSDIEAADGRDTATATMELVFRDGRPSEVSRRIFTFLVEDGRLILDSDFPQE